MLLLKGHGLALQIKHHAKEGDLALAQSLDEGLGNLLLLGARRGEQGLRKTAPLPRAHGGCGLFWTGLLESAEIV